jgi:hypothetical protein
VQRTSVGDPMIISASRIKSKKEKLRPREVILSLLGALTILASFVVKDVLQDATKERSSGWTRQTRRLSTMMTKISCLRPSTVLATASVHYIKPKAERFALKFSPFRQVSMLQSG